MLSSFALRLVLLTLLSSADSVGDVSAGGEARLLLAVAEVLILELLELLTLLPLSVKFLGEDKLGSVRFGEGSASAIGEELGIG